MNAWALDVCLPIITKAIILAASKKKIQASVNKAELVRLERENLRGR